MNNFISHFTAWHWLGFAILLFIIEILTGTGFLLWTGIAATILSLLLLVVDINISAQLIIFSIISILAALSWQIYLYYYPTKTDKPKLNKRAEQYIGRVFTLEFPIVNGMGRIHVDDSMWRLRSDEDLPIGTNVYISGADGVILIAKHYPRKSS